MIETGLDMLAWSKMDGLLPAVVQDADTLQLLMVGYMNAAALDHTRATGFATFYSRSKRRLWQKGESSGNRLAVQTLHADCDGDALLVKAVPAGPACHRGTTACFDEPRAPGTGFLAYLSRVVEQRAQTSSAEGYTARLLSQGVGRIAQKVGEEGVEVALAAVSRDADTCAEEIADLLYHLVVLMKARSLSWDDVVAVLRARHASAGQHPDGVIE